MGYTGGMNPEVSSTGRPVDAWVQNGTLSNMADAIQPVLNDLLEGEDAWRRRLKDFLHGRFLGHPLHPVLTDVPIGAWTVAAVCDALDVAGIHRYRDAARVAIGVGALGALGAAITGLADWSDTKDEPQRLGMLHATLNTASLTSYVVSLIARGSGARRLGITAAFAGYGLMSLAAYLGGELSLGMQLGVKHTAVPVDPPKDFVRVLDASALAEGAMQKAEVATIPLLVTRFGTATHAVTGVCTHRGAPLADGTQEGLCVRCPWHGSRFSLEDGRVIEGPATFGLARFETRVAESSVSVRSL
jgi:nitrite reductase/ring-hydroxylating ferredoxin subunit/uncharacterized membrane protein